MSFPREKVFRLAKGFMGKRKSCVRVARPAVTKMLQRAFVGRKQKKRNMRRLWIQQINAGARQYGVPYSHLVAAAKTANIELDRKVLADIAVNEPYSFRSVLEACQYTAAQVQGGAGGNADVVLEAAPKPICEPRIVEQRNASAGEGA